MSIGTIILRLCLAAILGGLVGVDREKKRRAAGLRTHILVSLGAALVMVTSEYLFFEYQGLTNLDPARLGAQVISGIGFLGAGTIIRHGESVKGLTTAASLWAVSCIGLAAGSGFYIAALAATGIVCATLILLGKMEKMVHEKSDRFEISLKIENNPGKIGEVTTLFGQMYVSIRNIEFESEDENTIIIKFLVQLPKGMDKEKFTNSIKSLQGVSVVE